MGSNGPKNLDLRGPPIYPAGPFSPGQVPLFTILTLFPEAVQSYLSIGVLGLAVKRKLIQVEIVDFRDFSHDRHRTVDDRPFGGGPGMVLRPEPVAEAVEWVEERHGSHRRIVLDPAGTPFVQSHARELCTAERTLLLAGRYEGFDERLLQLLEFEPFSIGDFVLSGGELPALCLLEATARLIPGVLGDERSAEEDSFQDGNTLDHPHFTRPRVFRGLSVPQVLLQVDHAEIAAWRKKEALKRTKNRRAALNEPDKA